MKSRQLASIALGLVALAWAASAALEQWWTADDAFISFRYAAHLAAGHGLAWNPGDPPLEGFTNLLYTVALAAPAMRLPAILAAAWSDRLRVAASRLRVA